MDLAPEILVFSTKGTGSNEEDRIRELTKNFRTDLIPFDKQKKWKSFRGLMARFAGSRRKLIVMEGTGIAGGIACLLARILYGHRFVFSSGDAVGPFVGAHYRLLGFVFGWYERLLCKTSSGFIGWTPYLVGRALTFGAPCGVTAAGWVIGKCDTDTAQSRSLIRRKWGISDEKIVFGLVGATIWNHRRQYCYGLELINAIRASRRSDIAVVVIGDGSGLEKLHHAAGDELGRRVFLPGRVSLDEVMECLSGMDIASLPQSTDAVGAFRYTTKVSEYRKANLPIVTTRIPMAYDLNLGKCWRLPGTSPWDPVFVRSLTDLMESINRDQLEEWKTRYDACEDDVFRREDQVRRVTAFLSELLESLDFQRKSH
ncbi:MAG: glycosyltransferase [Planctomycetota bacterium]|nr:glycosyltransferase [Planctomycetota bacterium]